MTGRNRRTSGRPGDEGFTVVEVLVAMTVFAVLAASVLAALLSVLGTSRGNAARVVAANLAARQVEAVRGLQPEQVVDTAYTVAVDGREFTVRQTTAYDTVRGSGSACAGSSGPAAFKRVSVAVTWPQMGGVAPVRSDTTRSLPVTGLSDGTGVVSVPVRDRDGDPVTGLPVQLVGPAGTTSTPTRADGCAVFAGLAPGATYRAVLSVPGWVDPSGAATVEHAGIVVTAGQVTKDPGFVYDRAGSATVTLTAPSGYPLPTAPSALLGVSTAPAGSPEQARPRCGTPPCATTVSAATVRLDGLFPHAGGWSVWGGTCLPSSRPPSPATFALQPGGTATVSAVPTGGVRARVRGTSGYVAGYPVHAVNAACPLEILRFPGLSTTTTTALRLAVPPGTWRLVIDPAQWSTTGRYREVVVTPGSTPAIQDVPL